MKNLSLVVLITLLLSACAVKAPLPKLEGDKYGYVNKQQKQIIAPQFHQAENFRNGYAVVVKNGFYGLINTQGEMVIEPQYTHSSNVTEEGYLIVRDDWGKSHLINLKNEKLLGDEYDYLWFFYDYITFRKGNVRGLLDYQLKPVFESDRYRVEKIIDDKYFVVRDMENDSRDNQGLIDRSGKVILKAQYRVGGSRDGLVQVSQGDKTGLMNFKGEFVLDIKYQAISGKLPEIFVKIDNKWGSVDKTGKYVIEPQYKDIELFNDYGIGAIYTDGAYVLINKKFKPINTRKYEKISVGDSLIRAQNGKIYILINPKTGKEVHSIIATTVDTFSKGYAVIKNDNKPVGMLNEKLKINFLEGYSDIGFFNSDIYTYIKKDGKYGLVDRSGKVVIEPKYDRLKYSGYRNEDHYSVATLDDKDFVIDLQEKVILDGNFSYVDKKGDNLYEVRLADKRGLIRLDGSYLLEPKYKRIYKNDRLYIVELDDKKQGLLNSDGETLLEPIYDSISRDSAGYDVVLNGKHNRVNRKGEYLYPQFYDEAKSVGRYDNLVRVKLNNHYGLIYRDKQVLDVSYDSIADVFDSDRGLLIIEKEGKFGLYKNTDQVLPTQYDAITPAELKITQEKAESQRGVNSLVSSGTVIWLGENRNKNNTKASELLLLSKDNKYGLISADLQIHLEPQFDELEPIARDVYKVRLGDKYALLDDQLNYLLPLEFDSLQAFEGAFIAQKNGKFGVITPNATLLDFVYDSIQATLHGVVLVEQNNQFGLADIINNQLTPLEYDSIVFIPKNDEEHYAGRWYQNNPHLILTQQQEKQILIFDDYEPEKTAERITDLIENPLLDESFKTLSLAPLGLPQGKVEITQQTYTGKTQMNLRIDKQGKNSTILNSNYSLMRSQFDYLEYDVAIDSFNSRHKDSIKIKNGDKQSLILELYEVDNRGRIGDRYELYFDYQPQTDKFVLSRIYNMRVHEVRYEGDDGEYEYDFEFIIHQLHSKKFQGITLDKFNANEVAEYLFYTNYEEEVKSGRLKLEKL